MDNFEEYAEELSQQTRAKVVADIMRAFQEGKEFGYDLGVQDAFDDLIEILKSFDRPLAEQVAEAYEKGEW